MIKAFSQGRLLGIEELSEFSGTAFQTARNHRRRHEGRSVDRPGSVRGLRRVVTRLSTWAGAGSAVGEPGGYGCGAVTADPRRASWKWNNFPRTARLSSSQGVRQPPNSLLRHDADPPSNEPYRRGLGLEVVVEKSWSTPVRRHRDVPRSGASDTSPESPRRCLDR
jgi:hypothetical protein